jgi:hypothetical protein
MAAQLQQTVLALQEENAANLQARNCFALIILQ